MSVRVSDCPFPRTQTVYLMSPDLELAELLMDLWWPGCMEIVAFDRGRRAVERFLQEPPDLLVVDNRLPDMTGAQVIRLLKSENVYRQVPVILCLDHEDMEFPWNWNEVEADDFLVRPFTAEEVRDRVNLTLCRALRAMDANPLSRLPGNTSIIQRIQDLIDRRENFALGYCDLDHFKSFNDKYGFSRGDEVLMMTSRVIVNTVKRFETDKHPVRPFVGHVGGDDFVFIVPPERAEEACKNIIAGFDTIVPSFYDPEDRKRGSIVSTDRTGQVRTFPLMAVSIAVVLNPDARLSHYGQASATAMELKKKAKETPTSSYVVDKRED